MRDVRVRHDGAKRNPFSEPEAGHHYARSMASWGTYLAWSGFGWDATTGEMRFANRAGVHFFAVGPAWGVCTVGDDKVGIRCLEGSLPVRSVLVGGQPKSFSLSKRDGAIILRAGGLGCDKLLLALRLDSDIRNCLVNVTPTIVVE